MQPLSEEVLRQAAAELARRAAVAGNAKRSPAERTKIARRAALVRHRGWCPWCQSEPDTLEHRPVCPCAPTGGNDNLPTVTLTAEQRRTLHALCDGEIPDKEAILDLIYAAIGKPTASEVSG